ncbi:MAG: hypothetical protein IIX48_05075 [Lachnospiraceae bacterium]|nr:hypothetical protein [Lachnospiraceae bacterium]
MSTMYGYGCITTGKTKKEIETRIESTKAYKSLQTQFQEMFFDTENLIVDVLNGNNPKRRKLEELLNTMEEDDILVLVDLNATGKNSTEVAEFYKTVIDRRINLLIPDKTNEETGLNKYSTCDFGGYSVHSTQELMMLYEELQSVPIKDNRGKFSAPMTQEFVDAYWRYENFFTKEDTAFEEAGGVSKTVFYKWAKEYELNNHPLFNYGFAQLEQEELYGISRKPKRHGKRHEMFDELVHLVDVQGVELLLACEQLGIPRMTDIDYKRYKLKTGRKALSQALFEYCQEELKVRND